MAACLGEPLAVAMTGSALGVQCRHGRTPFAPNGNELVAEFLAVLGSVGSPIAFAQVTGVAEQDFVDGIAAVRLLAVEVSGRRVLRRPARGVTRRSSSARATKRTSVASWCSAAGESDANPAPRVCS